MTGAAEYNTRVQHAASRLREAQRDYMKAIEEAAEARRRYELTRSVALVSIEEAKNNTILEAKAEVQKVEVAFAADAPREWVTINATRYAKDLAEGKRDAFKAAVANYRQELSSLQSLIGLEKSEADFARWAPQEAVGT